MASFRPFINDVSNGAISPKLYGKQDTELFSKGASALDNMFPDRFGQTARRGALKMIAEVAGSFTNCRLIPWSVSDSIDLLLVLTDGQIRAFDCSYGHAYGFISDFSITELKSGVSAYSGSEIHKLNYAIGNGSIYIANKEYPLFSIRVTDYNSDTNSFTFEYGVVELEGSIAYTPEIEAENSAQDDFLSTALLCSALGSIPKDTDIAVTTGYINNHPVSTVRKTVTSSPRRIEAYVRAWWGYELVNAIVYDSSDKFPYNNDISAFFTADFRIAKSAKSATEASGVLAKPFAGDGISCTEMLNLLESKGITPSVDYDLAIDPPLDAVTHHGYIRRYASTYAVSFTINFSDGATSIVITPSSADMIGFLTIDAYGIEVNKNTVGGAAALDCIAPWMVPNTAYRCDSSKKFCGKYPMIAVKNESAKKLDSDGVAIADGFNSITVTCSTLPGGEGITSDIEVFRTTLTTGQLGVIVNPFAYGSGRYPAFVAFHNGRMVVGGSKDEPNVLYMSKVNDFTNFCYFDEIEYEQNTIRPKPWTFENIPEYDIKKAITQQIGQDSAMRLQLITDESEAMRWAASMGDLVIGTATSEWVVPGEANAHNARVILMSRNGSSHIQGRFVRGSILFAQANNRALKMFENAGGEVSSAISDHAEHLFRAGGELRSFDFRQTPTYSIIAGKESGDAIYGVVGQNTIGFAPLYTRAGDTIESIVSIAAYDEDAVYVIAKRHTPSGYKYFIERLLTMPEDGDYLDLAHLDHRIYSSSTGGSGIVSGLSDFFDEGEVRIVFSSGAYGSPVVLSDGTCEEYVDENANSATYGETVSNPINTAFVIGYKFVSRYRTMRIEVPETEGLIKQPGAIHVRVYKSGDWNLVKQRPTDQIEIPSEMQRDEDGNRIFPFSGSIRMENPSGAATDQYVEIKTDSHEPLVIQSVVPYYEISEEA